MGFLMRQLRFSEVVSQNPGVDPLISHLPAMMEQTQTWDPREPLLSEMPDSSYPGFLEESEVKLYPPTLL